MLQTQIENEVKEARERYGAFNSTHEGYAVLKEEVDELWDVIKKNTEHSHCQSGVTARIRLCVCFGAVFYG